MIDVVGITDGGAASLTPALRAVVEGAELLCGGKRQLAFFPAHPARLVPIEGDSQALARRLHDAAEAGTRVVVLASGDPLLYGIGATLRRYLPASKLRFHPNASAVQLAWARIGEPWHDARVVSAHGRDLAPVVTAALAGGKLAILTDGEHSPAAVAREVLAAGGADRRAVVCERLGGPAERVVDTTLGALPALDCDPLNVLLLLEHEPATDVAANRPATSGDAGPRAGTGNGASSGDPVAPTAAAPGWFPGLPDAAFARAPGRQGFITKREVRVLSLAALGLGDATRAVWDIGAGTGALAIEAARLAPRARVCAIERDADCQALIRENASRFGVGNVELIAGSAPEACAALPRPDAIFIGGSGGALPAIVAESLRRLPASGRLVINLATLEGLQAALASLRTAGCEPEVLHVAVSRGTAVGRQTRLQALNPVFIVATNGLGPGR